MLIPVNDRVIVKPDNISGEIKKGGIIIPDGAREAPQTGTVLEVGPGRILFNGEVKPLMVKKGDKIIYSRYGGVEVKLNEDDKSMVLVLQEDDILVIIGDNK